MASPDSPLHIPNSALTSRLIRVAIPNQKPHFSRTPHTSIATLFLNTSLRAQLTHRKFSAKIAFFHTTPQSHSLSLPCSVKILREFNRFRAAPLRLQISPPL